MRFIDFDGVILDTEDVLFYEWRNKIKAQNIMSKIEYIQKKNWMEILKNSPEINDAFYYLKEMDPTKNSILTKVHSLENEAGAKIKFLNEKNIKIPIIVVPYTVSKSEVVNPENAILIDDSLANLTDWKEKGGIPKFFDKKGNNIDSWDEENIYGYDRIQTIEDIKIKKLVK